MNVVSQNKRNSSIQHLDCTKYISPLRSLTIVTVSLIVVESFVMFAIDEMKLDYPEPVLNVIDGFFLTLLVFPILYTAIFLPIRKLIENLQQSLYIAESSSKAKSLFLSTMNHEMRTPLNGIIGLTDMLKDKRRGEYDDNYDEIVNNIAFSSELLLSLINDLIDFSNIHTGTLPIESEKFDLLKLLRSVMGIIYGSAKTKNVLVKVFIDPETPKEVIGDATRLQQILLNVIGNAVKFSSRENGVGHVSLKVMCRTKQAMSTTLNFVVTDDGIGISHHALERIFEPFIQADKGISRKYGGTGLGLAISKYLIEAMNGNVYIKSNPGKGSIFTIQIPFKNVTEISVPDEMVEVSVTDSSGESKAARPNPRRNEGEKKTVDAVDNIPADCVVKLENTSREKIAQGRVISSASRHQQPGDDHRSSKIKVSDDAQVAIPKMQSEDSKAILVADDNEINRKVILHQLSAINARTDVACDGDEALRLWRENKYDLIMTDLHMPTINGYDLAKKIRSSDPSKHNTEVPIVAITADNSPDVKVKCLASGMDDYLVKPIRNDVLRATVDKWAPEKQVSISGGKPVIQIDRNNDPDGSHIILNNLVDLVGDDPAVIREFIDDYHTSLVRTVKGITRSTQAGQFLQVKELMHKLKSSSRAVGACVLGDLCENIEKKITDNSNPGITELIHKFATEVVNVIDQIKELRAKYLQA